MRAAFERSNGSGQPPSPRLSQRTNFPPPCVIYVQPRSSSRFRGQFESALQDYERRTGTDLVEHPLARRLQSCDTVGSVVDVLLEQAQGIDDFNGDNYEHGDGRLMKSLNGIVYVLHKLSISTVLGEVTDLVRQRL